MAPVDKPIDAEKDDKQASANPDRTLPFDEGDEQREWKDHEQHREQVADGERAERGHKRTRIPLHQSGRNRERPPHSRVDPMVEAACDHSQP
jgi:hypothetical protein